MANSTNRTVECQTHTPLQKSKIKKLWINSTRVTDLSPLKGMQLTELNINTTFVQDISVVKDMPLELLYMHECPGITDLSVLKQVPSLEQLLLTRNRADIEFLRTMPKLRELSNDWFTRDQTPELFWRQYDAEHQNKN